MAPLGAGVLVVLVPVPDRLTFVMNPADEFVEMVSVPAAAPAVVGSNCTVSVRLWPVYNFKG